MDIIRKNGTPDLPATEVPTISTAVPPQFAGHEPEPKVQKTNSSCSLRRSQLQHLRGHCPLRTASSAERSCARWYRRRPRPRCAARTIPSGAAVRRPFSPPNVGASCTIPVEFVRGFRGRTLVTVMTDGFARTPAALAMNLPPRGCGEGRGAISQTKPRHPRSS